MTSTIVPLLPEGLSLAAFWTLMATSFAGSFITAGVGIGGGSLVLAVMANIVPPTVLIPVHGVVQLGSNLGRAAMLIRHVRWPVVPAFAGGSVLGVALGGSVVVSLPPQTVQIAVGLFVLYAVFATPPAWLKRWPWLTGGVSSFLTMFFGATGPFVASFVKALDLPRHAFVATHATLMTVQHTLKIAVFGILGFAFGAWLGVALAMIVASGLGTLAGGRLLNRLSNRGFRRVLDVILVAMALRLIWAGLTSA